MKLYNHTTLPDEVVHTLLVKAARSMGCRSGKVLVEVNQGHRLETCGRSREDEERVKHREPKPEVLGPCAAIRRAFERDGETISVRELRAMTLDERWELEVRA